MMPSFLLQNRHGLLGPWLVLVLLLAFMLTAVPLHAQSLYVRNGSLGTKGGVKPYFTQETVDNLRKNGWTCPDADGWPAWWSGLANGMTLEWFATSGKNNDAYIHISGSQGLVTVYHGLELAPNNIEVLWLRGQGTLRASFLAYITVDGKVVGGGKAPTYEIKVNSEVWVPYRVPLRGGPDLNNVHPAFSTLEGSIDLDEVDILPVNEAQIRLTDEAVSLYGTGALIENLRLVECDAAFSAHAAAYTEAVKALRAKAATLDPVLMQGLDKIMADLDTYVLANGIKTVMAEHYNDMLVMARLCRKLAGGEAGAIVPVTATAAVRPTIDHKPGVRPARPGTVTITDIRSNKVRYNENENASTKVTVVNSGPVAVSGILLARMILDLDTTRDLATTVFSIAPGQTQTWNFSYNVGPETYGRAIEVQFMESTGKTLDRWQEYYSVAAEFYRVQQHSNNVSNKLYDVTPWVSYWNQGHYFAHETTDCGVQATDTEEWLSGQAGYHVSAAQRAGYLVHFAGMGITCSFYQTFAFCGQAGYEEARKYPEYVLYDENGQFGVDPVYGGYPNPMELASPIEIGPKRKELKIKPYLDRRYTPWQHVPANFASEDMVAYQTNCIKEFAKARGFKAIYIDGNMGVLKGYTYDGKPNVPGGKPEDYAALNARNHRYFSETLKNEDPNFGTWYNWSYPSIEWCLQMGLTQVWGTGTGMPGDTSDENIRAATDWKNVMLLYETGSYLQNAEPMPVTKFVDNLVAQRDFAVQKHGANTIIGYSFVSAIKEDDPGPSKWAWPTMNYVGSILIATQMHHAGGFYASLRPTFQFQIRYSRFVWAPDAKIVKEPEKMITVTTGEEVWWKKFVYKIARPDGYDLIVHLVRIPPTRTFDVNWVDEPAPLAGVKVSAAMENGQVQTVRAMRPYHFEEEQQPVESVLSPVPGDKGIEVEVPPFRYHTMLVFRVGR